MLSSLLPILEKEEEDIEIVPSLDKVSDRSSFYEQANGPNPVYQQYNRKGVDGIPINMMEPKKNVETVENTLYDGEGVADVEDKPVIVDTTKPCTTDAPKDDVQPIYAVPKKKSKASNTSGFLHHYQDADVLPDVSAEPVVEDADRHKGSGPDMSIFVSDSQNKLDSVADPGTEGDISASMDNDSDEVSSGMIPGQQRKQHLLRTDSIQSTTSDDCDLLDTEKKVKGRAKISHAKPKWFDSVNVTAKQTPSPKAKRAKSKPPLTQPVAKDHTDKQSYEQVTEFTQQQNFKPTIPQKPAVDPKMLNKGSPRNNARFDNRVSAPSPKSTWNTTSQASSKVTPTTGAYLTTSHPTHSSNPLAHLIKSSPRVKRRSVSPAIQKKVIDNQSQQLNNKPTENATPTQITEQEKRTPQGVKRSSVPTDKFVANDITDNDVTGKTDENRRKVTPTTGAYLNTSHPTHSSNPLAQLRAKSSPRVKPRSGSPAIQKKPIVNQSQQLNNKPAENATPTTQVTKREQRTPQGVKRASVPTDRFVANDITHNDVTSKTDEKKRPQSEYLPPTGPQKLGNHRASTASTLSFKEMRKRESDEFDLALKELDDLITTI